MTTRAPDLDKAGAVRQTPHLSVYRHWVRLCISSALDHQVLNRQCMSQQSAVPKPSLQGVRIKARKGAVKAQAKHEPAGTQGKHRPQI